MLPVPWIVLLTFVSVSAPAAPSIRLLVGPELSVTVPLPLRDTLDALIFRIPPLLSLITLEFDEVAPVRLSMAPGPMSILPLLVSVLILTTSPALANDRKAPALLVNIPLIVALLLLNVWNVPELLTLLTNNVEPFPTNSRPPTETESVPPVGVSVSVCPFCQDRAPATVVKFASPLVGIPPLITFSVPDTFN